MSIPAWLFSKEEIKENRIRSVRNFLNSIPVELAEEALCMECEKERVFLANAGCTHLTGICNKHANERQDMCTDFLC